MGFAPFHGLPVAPVTRATTPVPFRKTHVRHGGDELAATAAGFRLRPSGGVALRLRSSRLSACAPLFPLARPQTEAVQERFDHAFVLSKLTQRIE